MKPLEAIGTAVLLLLFGAIAPAYAQQGQHEQHTQQRRGAQQAQRGLPQEQHAQQRQGAQHAQRGQQQEQRPQYVQQAQRRQGEQQAQRGQRQEQRPQHVQQARREQQGRYSQRRQYAMSSQQRGRYGDRGGRIPGDRFRAHFGREHMFRIDRAYMAGGYSRFQYGGFWFGMYDPWPIDWYYTDDIYVDYMNGGYYLYSPMHPGVQVAIRVVM